MPTAVELNQFTTNKDRFAEFNSVLEKWFYKPDLQAIRVVLGAIEAHYLKVGDPAWLFLVAPPGSGKSTMSLMGASDLGSPWSGGNNCSQR
jgi:pantothenate kinase-related protein Tda10